MEISPLLLAKMLAVSVGVGVLGAIMLDVIKILRMIICGRNIKKRFLKLWNAKLPFSKITLKRLEDIPLTRGIEGVFLVISDLFLALFCGIALIVVNYAYNDGKFRFFTFFGFGVGFLAHYFITSKILLAIGEALAMFTKYLLFAFFDLLRVPILKIYNKFEKKIKKILKIWRLRLEKRNEKVYNVGEKVYSDEIRGSAPVKIRLSRREKQIFKDSEN